MILEKLSLTTTSNRRVAANFLAISTKLRIPSLYPSRMFLQKQNFLTSGNIDGHKTKFNQTNRPVSTQRVIFSPSTCFSSSYSQVYGRHHPSDWRQDKRQQCFVFCYKKYIVQCALHTAHLLSFLS